MSSATRFGLPLSERHAHAPDASTPFRILVLSDFGSDKSWGQPIAVDRDNFDEVLKQFQVQARLSACGEVPRVEVDLNELDDFHPDRLFARLELFAALRTRRQRLADNSTFADEAKAILKARSESEATEPAVEDEGIAEAAEDASQLDPSDLLAQTLEQTEAIRKPIIQGLAEGSIDIQDLVRRLVGPYVVDKDDPRQAEFIEGVDEAIADTMRKVLHHPSYQQLEAAWLGTWMLVRRLETGTTLKISLLNVSKQQLAEDLGSDDDLTKSRLHRLLVDSTSVEGAEPWTVVLGNYAFDANTDDVDLLGRVARVHAAAGSAFLAGALPEIVGCSDLTAAVDPNEWSQPSEQDSAVWMALRSLPAANRVALALPRFLGRSPYGRDSDPIDSFQFEEVPDGNVHQHYLWVNSAFAVACLLGRSFSHAGWSLRSAWSPELDDLPYFVYSDRGAATLKPCGEVELPLRAGEALMDAGLTAVYSVRGQGEVRIPLLRSLSSSAKTLAGLWDRSH